MSLCAQAEFCKELSMTLGRRQDDADRQILPKVMLAY
jgi:hypothetical protein